MKRSYLPDLISFLLILMFSYAVASKLIDIQSYKIQMLMQPVPRWTVIPLMFLVPACEISIVALLLFKKGKRVGLYGSAFLMLIFTIYVGLALVNFYGGVTCSCGGILRNFTWGQHFIFNLIFLSISIYGIIINERERRFVGK